MHWSKIAIFWPLASVIASCLDDYGCTSATNNYRSVAYYVNWAVYDRKFFPQDLPADKLTHVLYAFANISSDTGEVLLSDTWADTDMHFAGDSWAEPGTNLYGCFKQLYLLKKANRNLKVLLSVGGSSYSANFAAPTSTDSGRSKFASTAVSLVANLGLDGLDIDWEYLQDDVEAENLVLLLKEVREALDVYGNSLSKPYHFQLTVASPAGASHYRTLHLAEMDCYLDFWNLMAFDYAGSWSDLAADQANLFASVGNPAATPFDTQTAVDYYLSQGIALDKIVLGMPLYGRSFEANEGLGQPFNGVGDGTWEPGVYDVKDLPLSGATEFNDTTTGSSYSYDPVKKQLVSYDSLVVAKQKAAWIQQKGLGGGMWWESSADGVGNNSLIQSVVDILGGEDGSGLGTSPNQLSYPGCTYDNLKAGIPVSNPVPAAASSSSIGSLESCVTASSPSGALPTNDVSSTFSVSTPTDAPISTQNSAISSILTNPSDTQKPSVSSISSIESTTTTDSDQTSPSQFTNTVVVPGQDGVPGCAYVLASDLEGSALCSSDYCNCGGTAVPLLTSTVSSMMVPNCDYKIQPTAHSCPFSSAPSSIPPTVTVFAAAIVTCPGCEPFTTYATSTASA
ncbi:glycoside hydrolase family 18 protein [Cadophora sp. DSE1049]|nr:glycoside hydrolase family 18 protein [Cadophora sp. DSE1049]